jgi:hypothetical protein
MAMPTKSSPFQMRASAMWREMRRFTRSAPEDDPYRGLGPAVDYNVEAVADGRFAIYRTFSLAKSREQLAARMRDLVELMSREGYTRAIVDMRACKYDEDAAAASLLRDTSLPYAVSPLWRFALLVPADDEGCPPALLDSLLKLHLRAGMRMQKFEEYELALNWLTKRG